MPINSHNLDVINSEFVKIMNLNTGGNGHTICRTVGWVDDGIHQKEELWIFELELVPEDVCSQVICIMVPSICIPGKDTPKAEDIGMICGRAVNETPCAGMGGAPLICGTNVWGTASLLNKCGTKLVQSNYVVFTKISIAVGLVHTFLGNITLSGQPTLFQEPNLGIFTLLNLISAIVGWTFH